MKKPKQKWLRLRHRVVRNLAYLILYPYSKIKYGLTVDRFRQQEKRPYLVLFNHQTAFDQFFVGMSFRGAVYYVASEDLFSNGWVSSLIRWLVAPIPIKKQATDITAIKNCLRVAREGGTIAIAPEGNRTYSGRTGYMSPAIAGLARKLGMPIALYRIEGGYGVHPRWSDVVRRGRTHAYVSRVIAPEEYATMTDDQLFETIRTGLYVDEGVPDAGFRSKKRAEYLERAMYVCPFCGLSTFESHGNTIECTECHRKITYGEDKTLTGVGFAFPFSFVTQWYDHQEAFINNLDVTAHTDTPLYRDTAALSEVIVYQRKEKLRTTSTVALYGDRVVIDEDTDRALTLPFDQVTAVSVLGRNKLNIYHDGHIYQLKSHKRFNALKYVNLYYRYKNAIKGNESTFLGI